MLQFNVTLVKVENVHMDVQMGKPPRALQWREWDASQSKYYVHQMWTCQEGYVRSLLNH